MTKFRHLIPLFLLSVLMFVVVLACTGQVDRSMTNAQLEEAECRAVQNAVGETCIPLVPQRVIVLGGGNALGNLLAIGISPIAASSGWNAVEPFPEHLQNQLEGVEYVGSTTQPSLERILLLKPDLILAGSHMETFYQRLSQIAPTVIMHNDVLWKQQLITLSKMLSKEDIADQLINNYQQRVDELKQTLGESRTDLFISVVTMTADFGIWAYGSKYPTSIVLDDIGVQRPPSQIGDFDYTEVISLEKLDTIDGDVLFFVNRRNEDDKNSIFEMQKSPLWQQLEVVKNNQVYPVDLDHWYIDHSILGVNAVLDDLFKYLVNSP
ncbi:MAG: ABC transporter substrate-binding protein [Leptolyngbyaceae cyanobacterium]